MVLRTCNICEACGDRNLLLALIFEFLGVALFEFFGGHLSIRNPENPDWGDATTVATLALGNGIIYAVLVYLTRHVSGGHLNPSVTLAVTFSGHMNFIRGVMYVGAQLLGGLAGALASHLSLAGGTYCFGMPSSSSKSGIADVWELFSWEVAMTFVLIMVIYSSVIAPGHGDIGPFVIGLAVTGMMWAGVPHSGGAMNPARVVGPFIAHLADKKVFKCELDVMWYYIIAQSIAGVLGAFAALIVHGKGPHYAFSRRDQYEEEKQLVAEDEAEVV